MEVSQSNIHAPWTSMLTLAPMLTLARRRITQRLWNADDYLRECMRALVTGSNAIAPCIQNSDVYQARFAANVKARERGAPLQHLAAEGHNYLQGCPQAFAARAPHRHWRTSRSTGLSSRTWHQPSTGSSRPRSPLPGQHCTSMPWSTLRI